MCDSMGNDFTCEEKENMMTSLFAISVDFLSRTDDQATQENAIID